MQLATHKRLVPEASSASILSGSVSRTPEELANIIALFASSDGWMDKVRLCVERRWYERLYYGPGYDIWVISWLPGQSTGFHDHGRSAGAFLVASGVLEEHRPGGEPARYFRASRAHSVPITRMMSETSPSRRRSAFTHILLP